MLRSSSRLFMVAAYVVGLAGCGSGVGEQSPGRPITTAIPQGIYSGEITTRTQSWLNGVLVYDTMTTEPYQEIVNENGLPLTQPKGEIPIEGLVVTLDLGTYSSRGTVESINAFGNRLVIGYTGTLEVESVILGLIGTATYQYSPPDTLQLLNKATAISNNSTVGNIRLISLTSTSILTR